MTIMYVYYDYHMHRHTNHTNYNMRKIIPWLSNLANQIVHAIGGLINLLSTRLIRYQPRQVFMFFMLFSRTELTSLIHLHICMSFMFHTTCTPAHGISRLHNHGVGRCISCSDLHLRNLYMYTDQYHGWYVVSLKHIYILIKI